MVMEERMNKKTEVNNQYKSLQKEYKAKGVPMKMFDHVVKKIIIETEKKKIDAAIKESIKDMVDL